MSQKTIVAAVDLGTNTFQLLIATLTKNGSLHVIERRSEAVFLTENGSDVIGEGPFARAQAALQTFRTILDKHTISKLELVGTAALRKAKNAPELVYWAAKTLGFTINIITGSREAELIYAGARLSAAMQPNHKYLLFDIGGGSIEFIIGDKQKIYWAQSFPIGMMVLRERFLTTEPITDSSEQLLYAFLRETLAPVFTALLGHKIYGVIDTFGKFDVMLNCRLPDQSYAYVSAEAFGGLYQQLRFTTLADRQQMQFINPIHKKIILVPLLIWQFVFDTFGVTELQTVDYSLKEGLAYELLCSSYKKSP